MVEENIFKKDCSMASYSSNNYFERDENDVKTSFIKVHCVFDPSKPYCKGSWHNSDPMFWIAGTRDDELECPGDKIYDCEVIDGDSVKCFVKYQPIHKCKDEHVHFMLHVMCC